MNLPQPCQFCKDETSIDEDGFDRCETCNIRFMILNGKESIRVYFFPEDSIFYSVVMQFINPGMSWTTLWFRDKRNRKDAIHIPQDFKETHPKDIMSLANRLYKLKAFI